MNKAHEEQRLAMRKIGNVVALILIISLNIFCRLGVINDNLPKNSNADSEKMNSVTENLDILVKSSDLIILGSCYQQTTSRTIKGQWISEAHEPRYDMIEVLLGDEPAVDELIELHFHKSKPWVLGHKRFWFYKYVDGRYSINSIDGINSYPIEKKDAIISAIERIKSQDGIK